MNATLKFTLTSIIIFIIQVMIINFVNLSVYVYIFIIPFIILSMPYKFKTPAVMMISFLIGLALDIAGNGIIGLHAASLTAMAFTRNFFLFHLINVKNVNKSDMPDIRQLGNGPYLVYCSLSYLIFFIVYIPLETMGFTQFLFQLIRIAVGCIINILLTSLLSLLILDRRR